LTALSCQRIQISTNERNWGSRRVIEKCGFKFEAELPNFVLAAPTPEMLANGWDCTPIERQYVFRSQMTISPSVRRLGPLDAIVENCRSISAAEKPQSAGSSSGTLGRG